MPIEIKVICQCGQKYKFDVEPVNGTIPFPVRCPVCSADGSSVAHSILQEKVALLATTSGAAQAIPAALPIPAAPPLKPAAPRLQVAQHAAPAAPPAVSAQPAATAYRPAAPMPTGQSSGSGWPEFSMPLGIVGALVGAGVAFIVLFVFAMLTGIRFPLTGILVGFLTGLSARLFFRGTDNSLGVIAAVISLLAFVASQILIFGGIGIFNIISMIVSVSVAYKQASE